MNTSVERVFEAQEKQAEFERLGRNDETYEQQERNM